MYLFFVFFKSFFYLFFVSELVVHLVGPPGSPRVDQVGFPRAYRDYVVRAV